MMNEYNEPVPIPPNVLNEFLSEDVYEVEDIQTYIAQQLNEEIIYAEKVKSETVFDTVHEVWDVKTTTGEYWVITSPMNYYSRKHFSNLDYTLSFHIGVSVRITARQYRNNPDDSKDLLAGAWRKWEKAAQTMQEGTEPEDFQSVGMQCRECLLALVHVIADTSMIPPEQESPQAGNFIKWSEILANQFARGSRHQNIRKYMKSVAQNAWQVCNWLTHTSKATKSNAKVALYATEAVLNTYIEMWFETKSL